MPTKLAIRVVAASSVAALFAAGAMLASDIAARHALVRNLAEHPGLRVADIAIEPLSGNLVLRDLRWHAADAEIAIATVRLPLPSAAFMAQAMADPAPAAVPAPARSPAGTVQANDVSITSGTTTVHIKRIEMAGTKLTDTDLSALLDQKAADSLEARLRKLSAAAIVIPEIAIDDATVGSERHGVLHQILLANVVAGRASAVSAADSSLALTDGKEAINGTTGAIEGANVDLAQLAHVAATTRAGDAEPIQPLFDKAVVNAVKLTNVTRSATISAGSLTATGVRARALSTSLAAAEANAATDPTAAADSSAASSPASTALLDDFGQSFVIGTLDVDTLASQSAASDGDTSFTAAHLDLQALGAGKIDALGARDFHLAGPTAKLAIGMVAVKQLAIPRLGASDAERIAARPGQVDLAKVDVEVTTHDKATPDKSLQVKFTVDHFTAAQDGGTSPIPRSGTATIDNLGFDIAADGALTRSFYDMGYRHVSLSCALASTYDADARELTVRKLSVTDPAMGSLDVAMKIANFTPGIVSQNPIVAQASAISLLAKDLDLQVKNGGLFDKAIALKATQDGMSIADERAFGVDFFANKLPILLGQGAGAKTIGAAVAKFVGDPKTLHISLHSNEGLGVAALGMLSDPGAILDTLDIHATANQ